MSVEEPESVRGQRRGQRNRSDGWIRADRLDRFTDPDDGLGIRPAGRPPRPVIATDLLAQLGVDEADVETQRAAVARWLSQNGETR